MIYLNPFYVKISFLLVLDLFRWEEDLEVVSILEDIEEDCSTIPLRLGD